MKTRTQHFKDQQLVLGKTNPEMAELLCCCLSHIEHMRSGRRRVTDLTMKVLDATVERRKDIAIN